MDYALPDPQVLLPGESPMGFLMRNAEPYAFHDPARIADRLGLPDQGLLSLCSLPPGGDHASRFRRLLGIPSLAATAMTLFHPDASQATLGGHPVERGLLSLPSRRVCPECLQASQHHRLAWLVSAVPFCTQHRRRLLRACPVCGKRLRWFGVGVWRCPDACCGLDLREASAELVEGPTDGPAGLLAILSGGPDATGPLGLGFGECMKLALMLGRADAGFGRVGRAETFIRDQERRLPAILTADWEAMQDWPAGFHALLGRLRARSDARPGRYGLIKEFGLLPRIIGALIENGWGKPVGEEFASFLASQADLATTAAGLRRFGSPEALENRHMTLSEAGRYLEVSVQTMRRLAAREDLFLVLPSGQGAPSLVRADRVRNLKDRLQDSAIKQDAAALLDCDRKTLQRLERAGFLHPLPEVSRITGQRCYRRTEIAGLLARLEGMAAPPPRRSGSGRLVPLPMAPAGRETDIVQLVEAILDGRLKPVAIDPAAVGFRRILLDPRSVGAVIPTERTTLSLVEAARELGVEIEAVRAWVSLGVLEVVRLDRRSERGRRVTREALAAFRAAYCTANDVARMAELPSGRWTAERLTFLGVKAAAAPRDAGGIRWLFRRGDITREVVERLRGRREMRAHVSPAKLAFDLAARVGEATGHILGQHAA